LSNERGIATLFRVCWGGISVWISIDWTHHVDTYVNHLGKFSFDAMNDNQPLARGDRVQLREFPHIQGYVWDTGWMAKQNMVIVQWDDPEEDVYVTDPQRHLQKIPHPKKEKREH
jgi:hypothetical protein